MSRMPTGLRRDSFNCIQVVISNNSSSVPKPPGSATNASDSSAISALRSCIEPTSCSAVSPVCITSLRNSSRGSTPTASPPAPRAAFARPIACAAAVYACTVPLFEPQNTQTERTVRYCMALRALRRQRRERVAERSDRNDAHAALGLDLVEVLPRHEEDARARALRGDQLLQRTLDRADAAVERER